MTGNWRDRFEPQPGPGSAAPQSMARTDGREPESEPLGFDPHEYRPWILQRGRSRPAMMLELRRYEPRSGLWTGWALAYPHLIALEYTGDRLLSLDFGQRQFVIEGVGLDELARHIQQGTVLAVQEYAAALWASPNGAPSVTAIRAV